ncbi:hypothetical protein D3C80_1073760 [compost metagenome]
MDELRDFFGFDAGWQTAADHEYRSAFNRHDFFFQLTEFIVSQHGAGHHETILLTAGFDVNVQILPRPVFGLNSVNGDLFVCQ